MEREKIQGQENKKVTEKGSPQFIYAITLTKSELS